MGVLVMISVLEGWGIRRSWELSATSLFSTSSMLGKSWVPMKDIVSKNKVVGTGDMAQQLPALVALTEAQGLVLRHTTIPNSSFWRSKAHLHKTASNA